MQNNSEPGNWRRNLAGNGWNFLEEESYERAVAMLGGAKVVDSALAPVMYALHRNPEAFPETEVAGVRLAKTKLRINGPDITLAHGVWFRADAALRTVSLLFVEYLSPDDMLDDDIPF